MKTIEHSLLILFCETTVTQSYYTSDVSMHYHWIGHWEANRKRPYTVLIEKKIVALLIVGDKNFILLVKGLNIDKYS